MERSTTEVHAPSPPNRFLLHSGPLGLPSNEDSETTQTHARPFQGPPHTKASRDGSGPFIILSSYPVWTPTDGLVLDALSTPKYERASAKHLRGGQTRSNHTATLDEPTPAAEPFAGDGEERWVWCSLQTALQQRISWPEEASRDARPCLHTIRALSGHAPWC
jgi:hypothetical protein